MASDNILAFDVDGFNIIQDGSEKYVVSLCGDINDRCI